MPKWTPRMWGLFLLLVSLIVLRRVPSPPRVIIKSISLSIRFLDMCPLRLPMQLAVRLSNETFLPFFSRYFMIL